MKSSPPTHHARRSLPPGKRGERAGRQTRETRMVTPISSQHISIVKLVTGQRIAKATVGYPPRRRAEDAASWIAGEIQIIPTVKLAAEVFGVSLPPVAEARKRHEWLR